MVSMLSLSFKTSSILVCIFLGKRIDDKERISVQKKDFKQYHRNFASSLKKNIRKSWFYSILHLEKALHNLIRKKASFIYEHLLSPLGMLRRLLGQQFSIFFEMLKIPRMLLSLLFLELL